MSEQQAPPTNLLDNIGTLLLLAGVSGAGKSAAIDTLSDLGFFTVENLPVPLFLDFLNFLSQSPSKFTRTALSLDIDSKVKQAQFLSILKAFDPRPSSVHLIFLDSRSDIIVKRYGQTRRPHPGFNAERDKTIEDTIQREKNRLFPVKEISDFVIDTSELNIHELRREIRSIVEKLSPQTKRALRVNFLSFGFKHGVPDDCDLLMDVRFLPNPFFVEELKDKTGLEEEVEKYIFKEAQADDFIAHFSELLDFLLPKYLFAGKLYLNVGIGCTGGRHRSVPIATRLAQKLKTKYNENEYLISVKHRDLEKPQ